MVEFIGSKEILTFAEETGLKTLRMTFENKNTDFNVFEISEEEFEVMDSYPDEDWKEEWGWWRYSEGCVLEYKFPTNIIVINDSALMAWYDDVIEQDYYHDYYDNLFEYCLNVWHCSTEHNITAIAVGLAKLNNMSLADLLKLTT